MVIIILGIIGSYFWCKNKVPYLSSGDLPWVSILGAVFVIAICWTFDYISERLASIPLSWGAFIFIVIGIFALASNKE